MARAASDRLRRIELTLLAGGALVSALLLLRRSCEGLLLLALDELPAPRLALYASKLLLTEAALVAPFLVLALLGRALVRETRQRRFRLTGLGLSTLASGGVVAMLLAGMVAISLEDALDRLVAGVVPALVLLTVCAVLYGGLVWRAQHARLEPFMPQER